MATLEAEDYNSKVILMLIEVIMGWRIYFEGELVSELF